VSVASENVENRTLMISMGRMGWGIHPSSRLGGLGSVVNQKGLVRRLENDCGSSLTWAMFYVYVQQLSGVG